MLLSRSKPLFPPPTSRIRIRTRKLRIRTRTRSSLNEAFKSLISLDVAVPSAIAAVSAALLYRIRAQKSDPVLAEWILFTSPTPFNRSVLLRCPSVEFVDDGDRLLAEERHYVNLTRGVVSAKDVKEEEEVVYQRVCVGTEDGGVVSLDWPESLDMKKESGLDTTVVIVPGTTEGSMDRDVRLFVVDAMMKGCFPIVVNPRGCAGSPLTTARLFTAADSDDVYTAIQYVTRLRPWATLMGVGWGYGANMLTKYLAEAGETTPLTAAVCINNPFDLEEATRSFPRDLANDEKLIGGLKEILRANKELFQGKAKGFDLAKAFSATSVRDFDEAISMVSYDFDTIKDFYATISTRTLVNKVKIPALFIQSDDGMAPLFSVPRSSIVENPFTSLLLCSCVPSSVKNPERSAILWCQQIAIEWLAAVELALLKGRHPLLEDVDITINPSKGVGANKKASLKTIPAGNKNSRSYDSAQWSLSRKNANVGAFLNQSQSNNVNGFLFDPLANMKKESDGENGVKVDSQSHSENDNHEMQKDVISTNGGEDGSTDSDNSQALQTASVVMSMVNVSMPGCLNDEQKKKVLTAMEQGETLMTALEGAVPEDVRGKLTGAVTNILQTQGTKLNLGALARIRLGGKKKENPSTAIGNNDIHPNQIKTGVGTDEKNDNNPSTTNSDNNSSVESTEHSQEKAAEALNIEDSSEVGSKPSQANNEKVSGINEQNQVNENKAKDGKLSSDEQVALNDVTDASNNETKKTDSLPEADRANPAGNSEENVSVGSSASEQQVEPEGNDGKKKEESINKDVDQNVQSSSTKQEEPLPKPVVEPEGNDGKKIEESINKDVDQNVQSSPTKQEEPLPDQSSSIKPSLSVTQALDAFTGFDDSTQVAVNSVFGVLENMLDQFEKASEDGNSDEKNNFENQELINEPEKINANSCRSEVKPNVVPESEHPESSISNETDESYKVEKGNLNKVNDSLASPIGVIVDQDQENATKLFKDSGNKNLNKIGLSPKLQLDLAYLRSYYSTSLPTMESLDSDSTTDLFLDPEGGHWKMIDHVGGTLDENGEDAIINGKDQSVYSSEKTSSENIIEPSYVILENENGPSEYHSGDEYDTEDDEQDEAKTEELTRLIKGVLLEALEIEVGRKLGVSDLKELESGLVDDLEQVADAVSRSILHDNEVSPFSGSNDEPVKLGTIQGDYVIKAISSAVEDASHLKKVLPTGVIIGSSLASLRKYFQVGSSHDDWESEDTDKPKSPKSSYGEEKKVRKSLSVDETDLHTNAGTPKTEIFDGLQTASSNNKGIMVGAVTAALGASALFVHNQEKDVDSVGSAETSSSSQSTAVKNQNTAASSFAEKAMSVAAPVVPTKNDGEVDQDRIVTVLAELGQRGGILRLVGKAALLWGGIRGAMSLTDKLISFLHIAERPLFQRILGFAFMVLVLWSPIVVPLLPTLVQSWTAQSSNVIVECACVIGLYAAITMLIVLWGRRIRGYENPFERYGLDLPSKSTVNHFLKGLIGGLTIVLSIHSINALLGYANISMPSGFPSPSASALTKLKAYGSLLLLAVRGMGIATGISMVEEVLFRSWLVKEVAVDYGHYSAILISALAFSLTQRSLRSIPGFVLLSLALLGINQRSQGKLYASIGLRSGIMTTNFFLQYGGFLTYWPNTPFWLVSTHPYHPFDGVVGVASCALLAVLLFPWPSIKEKKISTDVQ